MPISGPATPEKDSPSLSFPICSPSCAGKPKRRPRKTFVRLFRLLLAVCFLLEPFSVWAHPLRCSESKVEIIGGGGTEQGWVCAAVQEAESFFSLNGMELPKGLTLLLTDRIPGNDDRHAIGQYDARSNRIRLLPYEQALRLSRKDPPPLGLPMSPELWRSYAVHEMAHAAAEKAFAPGVGKFTASEYIAAVAQLSSLPGKTRENIFRHFPNLSWVREGFGNHGPLLFLRPRQVCRQGLPALFKA